MYVVIAEGSTSVTYGASEIASLQFRPEADVTASRVPTNELWVNVHTQGAIALGSRIALYDDLDNLWCKYWVTYAEHEDPYTVRVHGESTMAKLDTVTLEPVMYSGTSVATALADVLSVLGGAYTLDSAFSSETLSGYCPKQSARVRLQWICMVIGAYCKDYFNDQLVIAEMDDSDVTLIPMADTYWRPKVTYRDHVTAVRATYYEYTQATPSRTDDYVEVNGVTYVQTGTEVTLTNQDAPSGALENVVELDNVTIVNLNNVSTVLSFLAKYHFMRTEVDLSCIDNGDYYPGMRVLFSTSEDELQVGYINECSFTFGLQAKADLHLMPTEVRPSSLLTIRYMFGPVLVDVRPYRLPIGYGYEIGNPYLERPFNGHKYVFRPSVATVTGTMAATDTEIEVPVEVALDYKDEVLHVVSVDLVVQSDDTAVIQ